MDTIKFALIILGPQGSGKGTQAQILAQKFSLEIFEMGAQLRSVKERGDDFANQVKAIVDTGGYVPDWMIEIVFKNYFENHSHDRMLFDGVPRTLQQSSIFDKVINEQEFPKPWVLHINLSKETSLKRLLARAREDDTVKIIENRLKNHHELTEPVIEKYRRENRVISINGEPSVQEVTKQIFSELDKRGINVH